jgi:UDPglucose--hexose-1-phosphate uridylyltransferase
MRVMRQNPFTLDWVVYATERRERPMITQNTENWSTSSYDNLEKYHSSCFFCPGNENLTPPERASIRQPGTMAGQPGWYVRVFENKYPALRPEDQLSPEIKKAGLLYPEEIPGSGHHEVIVETPLHNENIGHNMSNEQAERIGLIYWQRYQELASFSQLQHITIFKNHGTAAGASQPHGHSQLIAMPVMPKQVETIMAGMKRLRAKNENCPMCQIIVEEKQNGERLIAEEDDFTVLSPYAAATPYETWVVPSEHMSTFGELKETQSKSLGVIVNKTLTRINKVLHCPAYNYVIVNGPLHKRESDCFHWYLQIAPKQTIPGGLELGYNTYINHFMPEETAALLRQVSSV